MESTARPMHQIETKNRFMANAWNCQPHSQYWSRNHQRKLSHYRTRNYLWKLSHSWLMELTPNTNSRLTNEINRENRVIVDAWNRLWKLRHYRPEIVSENIVARDLEITTEIWVTTNAWNRQHDLRIKSKPKIDSWLTHGIVNHTLPMLIQKSSAKTKSL